MTRNSSPLIDNLDGVWTYPKEQPGDISATVVDGMRYKIYDSNKNTGYELSRSGEICGQEGVYFFPNEACYYSPRFFIEHNGNKFLILNKHSYDRYVREGRVELAVRIRVSDEFDLSKPPLRPSINILDVPYDNPFESSNTTL